jgi:hypothetical protein
MRTLNQSQWCVPLAPYQPVTDAIVCMRTFALRRHDRHGPVSPKADAVTWPDRPTKAQIPAPRAQRQIVCRVGCASQRDGVESTARERVTRGGGVETNHFDRRWRSGGVGRLRSLHQGRHRPRGPRGVLSRCAAGSFTRDGPESLGLSTHPTETDDRQRVGCFLLTPITLRNHLDGSAAAAATGPPQWSQPADRAVGPGVHADDIRNGCDSTGATRAHEVDETAYVDLGLDRIRTL